MERKVHSHGKFDLLFSDKTKDIRIPKSHPCYSCANFSNWEPNKCHHHHDHHHHHDKHEHKELTYEEYYEEYYNHKDNHNYENHHDHQHKHHKPHPKPDHMRPDESVNPQRPQMMYCKPFHPHHQCTANCSHEPSMLINVTYEEIRSIRILLNYSNIKYAKEIKVGDLCKVYYMNEMVELMEAVGKVVKISAPLIQFDFSSTANAKTAVVPVESIRFITTDMKEHPPFDPDEHHCTNDDYVDGPLPERPNRPPHYKPFPDEEDIDPEFTYRPPHHHHHKPYDPTIEVPLSTLKKEFVTKEDMKDMEDSISKKYVSNNSLAEIFGWQDGCECDLNDIIDNYEYYDSGYEEELNNDQEENYEE